MRIISVFTGVFCTLALQAQVGIGTSIPHASSQLDITATDKGLLLPRMTQQQREQITDPAPGLIIYNTTYNKLECFNSRTWSPMTENISTGSLKKLWGGSQEDRPVNVIESPAGGFLIAGSTSSSNTGTLTGFTSNGGYDGWLIKTGAKGNIEWQRLLGGSDPDQLYIILPTADSGYIVGGAAGSSNTGTLTGFTGAGNWDFWLMHINMVGNIKWQKLFGGSGTDQLQSLQHTTDGGYILAGYTSSNNGTFAGITNNGSTDLTVIKLDVSGNIVWRRLFGGTNADLGACIQQTVDGGYIVSGSTSSSNTGTLTGLNNNGGSDGWVLKLDASGNLQWQKLLGGNGEESLISIRQTADGGYIAIGTASSNNNGTLAGINNNGLEDFWIIKLDMTGNTQWQKLLGGTGNDHCNTMQLTADNAYIIAGFSQSSNSGTLAGLTNNGGIDYLAMKLDGTGNVQWQKLFGGSQDDLAYSIQKTSDGTYVVVGHSFSSNNGTLAGLTGNGNSDCWLIKLDVSGNLY